MVVSWNGFGYGGNIFKVVLLNSNIFKDDKIMIKVFAYCWTKTE